MLKSGLVKDRDNTVKDVTLMIILLPNHTVYYFVINNKKFMD